MLDQQRGLSLETTRTTKWPREGGGLQNWGQLETENYKTQGCLFPWLQLSTSKVLLNVCRKMPGHSLRAARQSCQDICHSSQPTANMDAVQRDETLGPLNFKAGEECVNGLVIQSDDGGERERPAGGQTHRLSAMAARWGFLFL